MGTDWMQGLSSRLSAYSLSEERERERARASDADDDADADDEYAG
jgi:hypothetical protein